jgi:hypothetical protein
VAIEHHYFEISHGKSAADGASATVKHSAKRAVTNGQAVIRNARELYQYCQDNLTNVGDTVYPSQRDKYDTSARSFHFVPKEDIHRDRPECNVKMLKGTMDIHSVSATGTPYQLQVRNLSCFCNKCCLDEGNHCANASHVNPWKETQLKFTRKQEVTVQSSATMHAVVTQAQKQPNQGILVHRGILFFTLVANDHQTIFHIILVHTYLRNTCYHKFISMSHKSKNIIIQLSSKYQCHILNHI